MPTVLRSGPYRFFFFSSDRNEPRHVHVTRERKRAKFWLEPVQIENSGGFSRTELTRIRGMVHENAEDFLRKWDEFFID